MGACPRFQLAEPVLARLEAPELQTELSRDSLTCAAACRARTTREMSWIEASERPPLKTAPGPTLRLETDDDGGHSLPFNRKLLFRAWLGVRLSAAARQR
jgi:hypothetical protein